MLVHVTIALSFRTRASYVGDALTSQVAQISLISSGSLALKIDDDKIEVLHKAAIIVMSEQIVEKANYEKRKKCFSEDRRSV